MRKWPRGSLNLVLMVVCCAVVFAGTVAATSVAHLHVSTSVEALERARDVAESVVARALARVVEDASYGRARTAADTLSLNENGAVGRLQFTIGAEPYCTNNLQMDAPQSGWGRRVPPDTVHLVAKGSYGASEVQLEVLVHIPVFPYALASQGPFSSQGGLLVGTVPEAYMSQVASLDAELLDAGHLVTNSPLQKAIQVDSLITGDLRAVGRMVVDPRARILGDTRPGADPVPLPDFDIASFDPPSEKVMTTFSGTIPANAAIEGFCKATGPIAAQGLIMDNALLYVAGDLRLEGGVRGVGAIIVNGKVTVVGGSQLTSDNQIALLASDDVVLKGNDVDNGLQGIVYTEGSFLADKMTLWGAFVGRSDKGGTMNNTRLLYSPQFTQIVFDVKLPPPPPPPEEKQDYSASMYYETADGTRMRMTGTPDGRVKVDELDKDGEVVSSDTISRQTALEVLSQAPRDNDGSVVVGDVLDEPDLEGKSQEDQERLKKEQEELAKGRSPKTREEVLNSLLRSRQRTRTGTSTSTGPGGAGETQFERFNLDLDEFLRPEDRMKIQLWRFL